MKPPSIQNLDEGEICSAANALDAWFTSQDIDLANAATIMCELQARGMLVVTRDRHALAEGLMAFYGTLSKRLYDNMGKLKSH